MLDRLRESAAPLSDAQIRTAELHQALSTASNARLTRGHVKAWETAEAKFDPWAVSVGITIVNLHSSYCPELKGLGSDIAPLYASILSRHDECQRLFADCAGDTVDVEMMAVQSSVLAMDLVSPAKADAAIPQ